MRVGQTAAEQIVRHERNVDTDSSKSEQVSDSEHSCRTRSPAWHLDADLKMISKLDLAHEAIVP